MSKLSCLVLFFSVCFAILASQLTGGMRANIRNYNYHVSLRYLKSHLCSGSIISTSHVLTSSSCIVQENEGDYFALLTNIQIRSGTDDKLGNTGTINDVSFAIIHYDYNARHFWVNDIAILKTIKRFRFSSIRSSIVLRRTRLPAGSRVELTGWGERSSSVHQDDSRYLKIILMKTTSHAQCANEFSDVSIFITHQSCAKAVHSSAFFLNGIGGSPLIRQVEIVGIVSSLIPMRNHTIIITRIELFTHWIRDIIEIL